MVEDAGLFFWRELGGSSRGGVFSAELGEEEEFTESDGVLCGIGEEICMDTGVCFSVVCGKKEI